MRAQRGFTLIEVLVALAIVTIGMAAVLEALTSSARATLYLRRKSFAEWVAINQIERVRLTGVLPRTGTSSGQVHFARRLWHWRQKVIATLVPGVERIEVSTRPVKGPDGHEWYATVTGYMGQAIEAPNPLAPQWIAGPISGTPAGLGAMGGAAPPPSTQPLGLP